MTGGAPMHFYTTQKISGKRSVTPDGFLLIEDVPLARVGRMIYGPGEIPVPPGPDGLIHIERGAEEVFRPQTVASANGKDLVDDHPFGDVGPDNYNQLSLGVLMNTRRGSGIQDDFLMGDILVKSRRGIDLINSGKVELSMGYDAGYVVTAAGRGYQKDIIYNHVALVDKGRCGPRCSIGDREYIQEKPMTTSKTADRGKPTGIIARAKKRFLDALRSGMTIDEEMLEETLGDEESEEVATGAAGHTINIHNHAPGMDAEKEDDDMAGKGKDKDKDDDEKTEDRIADAVAKRVGDALGKSLGATFDAIDKQFKDIRAKLGDKDDDDDDDKDKDKDKSKDNEKILGALELEAPPGTNDREKIRATKDCSFLDHSFQQTLAMAEILAPGIRAPTWDRAAAPAAGLDTICALRRTSLDHAVNSDVGVRQYVDSVAPGYRTADCAALKSVFVGAAQLKARSNNGDQSGRTLDFQRKGPGNFVGGTKMSIADVNKANAEYWNKKTG